MSGIDINKHISDRRIKCPTIRIGANPVLGILFISLAQIQMGKSIKKIMAQCLRRWKIHFPAKDCENKTQSCLLLSKK